MVVGFYPTLNRHLPCYAVEGFCRQLAGAYARGSGVRCPSMGVLVPAGWDVIIVEWWLVGRLPL